MDIPPYCYPIPSRLIIENPLSIIQPQLGDTISNRKPEITFNFSCKHTNLRWIRRRGGDPNQLQFLGDDLQEALELRKSMRYRVPEIDEEWKVFVSGAVSRGIRCFLLSYENNDDVSRLALDIAWDLLRKLGPRPHNLKLFFQVVVIHGIVLDESSYEDWVMSQQQVVEAAMVPATDASIQALQSQTIGCSDQDIIGTSCAVCLEDFEAGDGVVTMTCSHIYHGECITKWLRTSHYCPVCRHQMPTKTEEPPLPNT